MAEISPTPAVRGARERRMVLGLRLAGCVDGASLTDCATLAERATFDVMLLGPRPGGRPAAVGSDPLSMAAFLISSTRRIGLAAAVAESWAPFHVARALATLDHLSGGRCGWLATSAQGEDPSSARSAEHLDVVLQLFDSWDDDALAFDKVAAVFADRAKVRRIRHAGPHYAVDGPLNVPRPPQGRPVLFQPLALATADTDVALFDLEQADLPGPCGSGATPPLRLAEIGIDLAAGGTACEGLVRRLAETFARGQCDGFVLAPVDPSVDIALLASHVTPDLCARGMMARAYAAGDLRTRLGRPRPVNRFAP